MENSANRHGFALVSVLWALSILSLIAAEVLSSSSLSYQIGRNEWTRVKAATVADAAVRCAILALTDGRPQMRWHANGAPRDFEFEGEKVQVRIEDELGKIDLNAASEGLIRNLFVAAGLSSSHADELAARVVGWREIPHQNLIQNAANSDNDDSPPAKRIYGRGFQTVEELLLVQGMTQEIFKKVAPIVTVYSRRPTIDPDIASPLARRALGGDGSTKSTEVLSPAQHGIVHLQVVSSPPSVPTNVGPPLVELAGRAFSIHVDVEDPRGPFEETVVVRLTGDPAKPFWVLSRK